MRLSFIIPAHNEEDSLPKTLDAIHSSAKEIEGGYEIIVADDASTDRSAEIARMAGAKVIRIEARQIAAARNAGARVALGQIFVFVDADTTIHHRVVKAAIRAIENGAVGGGSLVDFEGRLPLWARLILPPAVGALRIFKMASGCFLFCTRQAFSAVGGFDEKLYAGEEAIISRRLKKLGKLVVLCERVTTSGRKLRAYSGLEIARVFGRLAFLGRRGVSDRRHLDVWYGPRRPDPDLNPDPIRPDS